MRRQSRAFTLIEILIVVAIIMTLAGLMFGAATYARQRAYIERSRAVVQSLSAACESYWVAYHDYPYPNPDSIRAGAGMLGENSAFRKPPYFVGTSWTNDAYNVALVWLLGLPRTPEPFISLQEVWYQQIPESSAINAGRTMYRVLDGFGNAIQVDRPWQYSQATTWIRLTSAGPDGQFGADASDPKAKDNIEVLLMK